ncbi:MAG: hypothetical protein ABWZ25_08910 [Chitinophagaceae bacterium]
MASFNGFIRSAAAAHRRAQRSHQQHLRESARTQKFYLRQEAIGNAGSAVHHYNEYIDVLKTVHKDVSKKVNWSALLHEPPPMEPVFTNQHEKYATDTLLAYKPSFFGKVFGSSKKTTEKLSRNIEVSKEKDSAEYKTRMNDYTDLLKDQEGLKKLATGILAQEVQSYIDAIDYFKPYSEIAELGSKVEVEANTHHVTLDLHVNSSSIIPNYVLSQTSTGKLSKKNMAVSKFNELYQDYVCSSVLRVARETFALLPLNLVVVNALSEIHNTATGITSTEVILTVAISPDVLQAVNFELIDPSDSMRNFHYRMKFGKTTGFVPVERIKANSLIQ